MSKPLGQIAYEASRAHINDHDGPKWREMTPSQKAIWEGVAEATCNAMFAGIRLPAKSASDRVDCC